MRINLETAKAEQKSPMRVARGSHGICCIGFMIYVCSGKKSDQNLISSFERYDVLEDKWEMLQECQHASVRSLLIPFEKKFIYKVGGVNISSKITDSVVTIRLLSFSGEIQHFQKRVDGYRNFFEYHHRAAQ